MSPEERAAQVMIVSYDEVTTRAHIAWVLRAAETEAYQRGVADEREAAARAAEEAQRHYEERCPRECRCADGFHIAAAIRAQEMP